MAAKQLKCRECGTEYALEARYVCSKCFGPLEVGYDHPKITDVGEVRRRIDPHHTERLAAYWGEALGGPPTFSSAYGDGSSVVRIHSGNGEHEEMDTRAVACRWASSTPSCCSACWACSFWPAAPT